MALASVTTLKGYFNTGDKPTETQFANLIETIANPYYNGHQHKTAGFTAAAGYIYTITDLDGCAVVLPTPVVGDKIKLVFTAPTSNTHTVTSGHATHLYSGYLLSLDIIDGTEAENTVWAPDGSNDRIITLNRTTTGGSAEIELVAISTTEWRVSGRFYGSGNIVTPFS
tara:strand:- start:45 stop:551 length:507 start_codon:yes stop_codon:yes gene_type:complete